MSLQSQIDITFKESVFTIRGIFLSLFCHPQCYNNNSNYINAWLVYGTYTNLPMSLSHRRYSPPFFLKKKPKKQWNYLFLRSHNLFKIKTRVRIQQQACLISLSHYLSIIFLWRKVMEKECASQLNFSVCLDYLFLLHLIPP